MLRPVYDETDARATATSASRSRRCLAHDTAGTIDEARRLWAAVDATNVMIKVPGDARGHPGDPAADRRRASTSTSRCCSRATRYAQVAEAYIAGLEALAARGGDLRGIAQRGELLRQPHRRRRRSDLARRAPARTRARRGLVGKVAIANAKLAYQDCKELCRSAALAGARRRRARGRSGCCGRARAPRTRASATCSTSRR